MINNLPNYFNQDTLILLILHVVISLILAIILSAYLSKRYKNKENKKRSILFMFLFNLCIPVIGYILSIWISWYLLNVKYEKKVLNTSILNLDEFSTSFLEVERIFGEGSMSGIMNNKYTPKAKKLKALSSLAENISPENLNIIKETLASTDDEIRMFGYAIINKAEKILSQKINYNLNLINLESVKRDKDNNLIANSARELAYLYWEMVYTELSHDSLKDNFLNSVTMYIDIAKEHYIHKIDNLKKENHNTERLNEYYKLLSNLHSLMGRVHMKKNHLESAKAEFTIAQEISLDDATTILPYLAEVYYLTGKYKVVSSIINKAKDLELNTTLNPIVNQWKTA